MPFDFTGRVIAISGAASGIGIATAEYLYQAGAKLSLSDARSDALVAAIERLKTPVDNQQSEKYAKLKDVSADRSTLPTPQAQLKTTETESDVLCMEERILAMRVNVASSTQVNFWISRTVDSFKRLDGAANMAGVSSRAAGIHPITEVNDEDWQFNIDINLSGTFYCMRAQLQAMEKCRMKKGSIVNASSIYGISGKAYSTNYSAAKHGIVGLTRSVAKEIGGKGINVNCVAPGIINTPMVQDLSEEFLEGHQRTLQHEQALHRMADPMEIAKVNAFLLSDDSSFITGAVYVADGGQIC